MTTVKRYYFFDQPIDFLAPSRSRSAFVAEADYLVLQQAAQEAARALELVRLHFVNDLVEPGRTVFCKAVWAKAALDKAGVKP